MQKDEGVDLKKTMETLCFDDTLSVYDVMSMKSSFTSRVRENLRSELKDIKCIEREKGDEDNSSQYTNKYFQYDNKFLIQEVLPSLNNVQIQEDMVLEDE